MNKMTALTIVVILTLGISGFFIFNKITIASTTSNTDDMKTINMYNEDPVDFTKEELKEKLSEIQFKVTQKDGTEKAFNNAYWDNEEEGIYVDIVSREPLFSSEDKYKSGTGWPSFTKPLVEENIITKDDPGIFGVQTEVRSKGGDSHLGHVFEDGPEPKGLRYCMNSTAMKFIPKEEMKKLGYEDLLYRFDEEE